jgi:hypothetical protein
MNLCEQRELLARAITAAAAGDNTLIAAQPGTIELLQLILINSAAQTLAFYSGPTLLQVLPAFAALEGYELAFSPGLIPYWRIPPGTPLILNLSAGTRVDGFLNYRVKT